ncbi:hypothetical protein V1J52_09800 [Streptomyces sp. TRM 70351]|uniref:hypothetical protein n=1 Tax=Streptomyces sp. TRM 70351 TaxID=3116552 RepID=UPI002E7B675A|nr:hypothetical protein [Streptomyces sp. TRM 70351]MEE1928481.1 hypothetical protein [Streptomyces sp. TRM 70351]
MGMEDREPVSVACAECVRLVGAMDQAREVYDWSEVSDCVVLLRRHAANCTGKVAAS